jgi:hypothetical protein
MVKLIALALAALAILLVWTVYILATYCRRLKRDISEARAGQAFYYQKYQDATADQSALAQARAKHALYRRARNAEGALRLAERDLQTSHEHLKYYIEYAADMEKMIQLKDIEISEREEKNPVNEPLLEAIRLQRDVIINKCKQTRDLQSQLAAAKQQLATYSPPSTTLAEEQIPQANEQ